MRLLGPVARGFLLLRPVGRRLLLLRLLLGPVARGFLLLVRLLLGLIAKLLRPSVILSKAIPVSC